MLKDKDYPAVIRTLLPLGETFICLTPESGRALTGEALAAHITSCGGKAVSVPDIPSGLETALSRAKAPGVLVIFGSFYLAGPVRNLLKKNPHLSDADQIRLS